jgi:hypothetical protein
MCVYKDGAWEVARALQQAHTASRALQLLVVSALPGPSSICYMWLWITVRLQKKQGFQNGVLWVWNNTTAS